MSSTQPSGNRRTGLVYEAFEDEPERASSSRSSYAILAEACGYKGDIPNLQRSAKIQRLKQRCEVYNDIMLYIKNSQERGRKLKVIAIYKVERNSDKDSNFDEPYRLMLWHGTRSPSISIPGIIENGFRKGVGGLFGAGCYFADRIAKSQQYCGRASKGNNKFFVLAEVSLGKVYKSRKTRSNFKEAPSGFDTVKGSGSRIPNWTENKKYYDAILPCGRTVKATTHKRYPLRFNEYIAYDPSRIKVRFIVQCQ